MEEVGNNNNNNNTSSTMTIPERKARPQEQLNCPRCNSTNTKFCYYNNYSLTQPRYFCKTCRRYWTAGGSLRNVPVGGGSRKNKRSSSSSSTSTSSSTSFMSPSSASSSKLLLPDLNPPNLSQFSSHHQNPSKAHHGQDLNLGFPLSIQETNTQGTSTSYNCYNYIDQVSVAEQEQQNLNNQPHNPSSCASTSSPLLALELLRSGIASRGLNSYIPTPMPDSNNLYPSSGFPLQDLKPALTFSVDGLGNRYGVQDNGGRMFFPFGEVKQLPDTSEIDQSKAQGNPTPQGGYWNGMLGGGSW